MIKMLPTAALLNAEEILHSAQTSLILIQNERTPVDQFNAYNRWAVTQTRALSSVLVASEVERLITTPRCWALQSVSPVTYGLEIEQRIEALHAAHIEIGEARYRQRGDEIARVIVDTNVLLHHHHELLEMEWHNIIDERPHVRLIVTVPVLVVEELDRLKRSQGNMQVRGQGNLPRRTAARQALHSIREFFREGGVRSRTAHDSIPQRVTEAELHVDAMHRSDIGVDRALIELVLDRTAFAARTYLVTYDDALVFRARAAGIRSIRLEEA